MHTAYPPFSIECVQDLVRLARGRTVRDELPLFAKCVWSLVGTALGATVGEPDGELLAAADDVPLVELESARDELQALAAAGDVEGLAAADDAEAIDPATLMLIIQLATKLIEAWVNRKRG